MTDPDDTLHSGLTALADRMPVIDIVEPSIRRGRRMRAQRRSALGTAGTAVLVAAVVVPLSLSSGSTNKLTVVSPPAPVDPRFQVAPPAFIGDGVEGPRLQLCRPSQVRATTGLQRVGTVIAGVVTATADHCALPPDTAISGLASTSMLADIPVTQDPDGRNLAVLERTDLALARGKTTFGFLWTGSWCGGPIDAVRLRVGSGFVRAPIQGPRLGCPSRPSSSAVIPGAIGPLGDIRAVLPAPPAWSALKASLTVAPNSWSALIKDVRVTFSNTSDQSVSLAPRPIYVIGVQNSAGDGTSSEVVRPLPVGSGVVPAHGSLTMRLPTIDFFPDFSAFRTGQQLTVTFGIAGVPEATATTIDRISR
jgi:hypothetical protein